MEFKFPENIKKLKWYILASIIFIAISVLLEGYYNRMEFGKKDFEVFQKRITEKEKELNEGIVLLESKLNSNPDSISIFSIFPDEFYKNYEKNGLAYFFFSDSILSFWSDNIIPIPNHFADLPESRIVNFGNSIFLTKKTQLKKGFIYGLIHLKSEHGYANKMLENGFNKSFKMNPEVDIILSKKGPYTVMDSDGEFLLSLDFANAVKKPAWFRFLIVVFYCLALFSFLFLLRRLIHNADSKNKNLWILSLSILLPLLYRLLLYFQVPKIIFHLDIFTILTIRNPDFSPTIGDLFLIVSIGFFIVYSLYVDLIIPQKRLSNKWFRQGLIVIFIVVSFALYILNAAILKFLILNTNISFETFKVLDLSIFTFLAFTIMALIFSAFVLIINKLLTVFHEINDKKSARLFMLTLLFVIFISVFSPLDKFINIESTIFFILICLSIYYFRFISRVKYRLSGFVLYVVLFSIFTVMEVTRYSNDKNIEEMKMMAVSLSTEHDPVAELLFVDLEKKIQTDEEVNNLLDPDSFDFEMLYNLVQRKYFSGFWDKYDLQITVCGKEDSVFVSLPDNKWYPCYSFFYEALLNEGSIVPNTNVYFLDNLNGRISYFFTIVFNPGEENEVTMFLELDSRLILEGLGYPSLLLDESLQPASLEYSYAKYNGEHLITSIGDFNYSTNSNVYCSKKSGFEQFKYDDFDHVAYHPDNENTVIVSKPSVFWIDLLISFSYIFSFFFLSLLFLLLTSRISPVTLSIRPNFKNRIQIAMNSVLLFSFILIGAGTVYFSINQYKEKQYEILEEKVQSVYIELIHKLEFEEALDDWSSEGYYNLDELLQKFSNVFVTDINLFDQKGILLASSRPEIFQMGLLSDRMDAFAFQEMTVKMRSEFVQTEVIGKMKYLSVYVPFVNAENHLLAYLNLPYFTRQDALTREITNLVVAIINIVVLLSLLGFTIAVFMANTITMPLNLIQQKLARVTLSEKNEFIEYTRKDEIGNLVQEYNQMVDQLQKSAELMAKSERESAWREMAKQIAHEIKNPLTPMKLNIQHLQRTIKEDPSNIEKQVNRISATLIEQIENLSSIATEFSNFAKMPQAKNEILDLEKELKKSIELFTDYDRCILTLKVESRHKLEVLVDREQISRVFINLIKNGIQAIPENESGNIEVRLSKHDDKALITIRDSGKGMSEEVKAKLFQPNFTTKTSGMGLGLAIVKNIVQNAGGEIYFETSQDKGSTFYVELPLVKNENG